MSNVSDHGVRAAQERAVAIREAVAKIRAAEREMGITRESLELIKTHLLALAAQEHLFQSQDFPPPAPNAARSSCLYRIAEDDDHRFALYANSARAPVDTPPHNHTTWAVIVGVQGEEHNRFYQRSQDGGVEQTGDAVVAKGSGVAFLPEDLHSIHIHSDQPVLNFHMYGLALEQLHRREYYNAMDRAWHIFPAHSDIREARPGFTGAGA